MTALWVCCSSAIGATLHVDDFQSGATTLGWSGGSSPTHVATGGPSGAGDAFLRITTPTGGHLATFNGGSPWAGDYAAVGAAVVNVDLMSPPTSASLPIRLVLFGPTTTSNRWTSTAAQTVPNDGAWRSYTFSMAESDLTRVLGVGTHQQLMASVVQLMLRYDPGTPSAEGPAMESPGGILNIDNIELAAADVPPGPGDFNGDGVVDGVDLDDPIDGWRARFGVDLDGSDFLVWQRHLGAAGVGASARAASVPEPVGVVLGGTVAVMVYARRGRGRPGSLR